MKIHYTKPPLFSTPKEEEEAKDPSSNNSYLPFELDELQLYNPLYSIFFEMNENNYNKIGLNHQFHAIEPDKVYDLETGEVSTRPIFFKYSPLLDPFRYMSGKYDLSDPKFQTLPKWNHSSSDITEKMLCIHNASYVDAFFSYLSSQLLRHHGFQHSVDYYGSYLAKQRQFRVCVTDDLDYLQGSEYFNENAGKLFYVDALDVSHLNEIRGSHKNKPPIEFLDEDSDKPLLLKDVVDINLDSFVVESATNHSLEDLDMVYAKDGSTNQRSSSASSSDVSSNSSDDTKVSDTTEEEDDDEDEEETGSESTEYETVSESETDDEQEEEEEEDEEETYGYIYNFPVQMICMEKCEGTLDELYVQHQMNEEMSASCMFQVIMILLFYQKAYQFTHNDLHTNNIMYVLTDEPYLYYQYKGKTYRVPTYGRIYKMIDFGRAIYKFQGKLFCSDSFAHNGDAATQYNCEPFMNKNKPRLEPNYSFDLSRLGCSIFDFIMENSTPEEEMDQFQKLIYQWCLDDNGRNILYKSSGEERYSKFKLYKMIARTVHHCLPEDQVENPLFKPFVFYKSDLPENAHVMNVDLLPTY